MVRPARAHPTATAHQPNLVTQKTHLLLGAFVSGPVSLASLLVFQYPISCNGLLPIESCF